MAKNLLLLNGPNLNFLGIREPEIYGSTTLLDVELRATTQAREAGANITIFQSNHEGILVDYIYNAQTVGIDAIIINPGGLAHTSVILRDALASVNIQFIEVHISNIYKREKFRHFSYLSDIATAVLCGFGIEGYRLAIDFFLKQS